MVIKNLKLTNFRNWQNKSLEFSSNCNLIIGPNASGKTNILEAIFLLSSGTSFRARVEKEMISNGGELARISCQLDEDKKLEIVLTTGEVAGKRVANKIYKVNDVNKRKSDFVGNLRSVLFRPEDIEITTGSPALRRDYLDSVLIQVNREYVRAFLSYRKGLRQRNKLLEKIKIGEARRSQLMFWDNLLIKNGNILSDQRRQLIDFLDLRIKELKIEYDFSPISQARLEQYSQEEISATKTLVGPHRDDIVISKIKYQKSNIKKRNLALYGSRGEQRMAIFYLKLAELEYISQITGQRPVLLLDDIFSELDKPHRDMIIKIIPRQQTIITATETDLFDKHLVEKLKTITIEN